MAKYYGQIGFAEPQVETAPGVWEDVLIEKNFFGDVLRNYRALRPGEYANNEITVSNLISIVSDAYADEHYSDIRYIRWMGKLWTVANAEVLAPRLNLTLGGIYNGPTAPAPDTSGNFDGE